MFKTWFYATVGNERTEWSPYCMKYNEIYIILNVFHWIRGPHIQDKLVLWKIDQMDSHKAVRKVITLTFANQQHFIFFVSSKASCFLPCVPAETIYSCVFHLRCSRHIWSIYNQCLQLNWSLHLRLRTLKWGRQGQNKQMKSIHFSHGFQQQLMHFLIQNHFGLSLFLSAVGLDFQGTIFCSSVISGQYWVPKTPGIWNTDY